MRAIVLAAFGGPENFKLRELPIPVVGPGEIRVRIRAVGFNPVDAQIRSGRSEAARVKSKILGRDFSGVVDAVHQSVAEFAVGDEVFGNVCNLASSGTYAEYIVLPAELVAQKPAALTHEMAAAIPVAGITAALCLEKARLAAGKSLLVAGGSGGVGTFCLLLASRMPGVRVHATAGSEASSAYLAASCGISRDRIIDYRQGDWVASAMQANGAPFDAVIDLVGDEVLAACCRLLALEGNLVSATQAPTLDDFELLFDRNASFHPIGAHSFSLSNARRDWLRYRRELQELGQRFSTGLPSQAVKVVGPFTASTVTQAHRLLDGRHVQGKLVMSS